MNLQYLFICFDSVKLDFWEIGESILSLQRVLCPFHHALSLQKLVQTKYGGMLLDPGGGCSVLTVQPWYDSQSFGGYYGQKDNLHSTASFPTDVESQSDLRSFAIFVANVLMYSILDLRLTESLLLLAHHAIFHRVESLSLRLILQL